MQKGWIKLHRSIQDNFLWLERRDKSRFEAWIDLLMCVNHKAKKVLIGNKTVTVKRGESVMSLESWGTRWGWSKSKVRRFLLMLEKEKMLCLKCDQKSTHLSICNYESYQTERTDGEPMVTLNKNDKNEKKDINLLWKADDGWQNASKEFIAEMAKTYPHIDVGYEMDKMHQWLLSNPSKNNKKQWRRFVTSWLGRANDNTRPTQQYVGRTVN